MLEEFGLTKSEENVYLALVRLGTTTASDIIKKTRLHRTTVYDVLRRLINKGFIGYATRDNLKIYSISNSSKFLDITLEEKKLIEDKERKALEIMQKIGNFKKELGRDSTAKVFIGIEGWKTIMNDIIEVNKNFIIFGSEGRFIESLPEYVEQWARRREEKNIKAKIIMKKTSRAPIWKLNEIRFIGKEYCSPTSTFVYGDRVAIFINDEAMTGIVIENEKLAKSYQSYFKLLWKLASKNL